MPSTLILTMVFASGFCSYREPRFYYNSVTRRPSTCGIELMQCPASRGTCSCKCLRRVNLRADGESAVGQQSLHRTHFLIHGDALVSPIVDFDDGGNAHG